ncbi:MAG: hypothetical protein HY372_03575 [Candidatus Andersenbacteria bacterium]|nr:hypothetical protein [Candidatus Andersenbacteria bacterium]
MNPAKLIITAGLLVGVTTAAAIVSVMLPADEQPIITAQNNYRYPPRRPLPTSSTSPLPDRTSTSTGEVAGTQGTPTASVQSNDTQRWGDSTTGTVAGVLSSTAQTFNDVYDQQPGEKRFVKIDDQPLAFDVYKPAKYLYVDLREDGTYFKVLDNGTDVFRVDYDKNIIAHHGSKLDIRGKLVFEGENGKKNQIISLTSDDGEPQWVDGTKITSGDVSCTDCLGTDEIADSYVINTGDSMTGDLTLNGQRDVRFADSDSSNYVGFEAPASISNDTTWTLPNADGSSNQVLTTNGSSVLSWTTASGISGTLQNVYDNDSDGSDAVITLSSSDDSIEIDNPSSSGTDSAFAFQIDQNATGTVAFNIDHEGTTADAVNIAATVLTTGRAIDLPDLDALTTGTGLNLVSNSSDTSERYLVNIDQDHASATGARALRIKQDSTATAQFIDQNGNGLSLDIDSEATTADILNVQGTVLTTGRAIDLPDLDALTSGTGLNIVSNSSSTTERYLVNIDQDHADASGSRGLRIKQDAAQDALHIFQVGAGDAIFIDSDSATGSALNIDAESTTADVVNIAATVLTTGRAIDLPDLDALTTGTGLNLISNSSDTTERYLVNIDNDNTAATGTRGLRIKQDAAQDALHIFQVGAGDAIFIDSDSATGTALNVDAESTTADVVNIAATVLTTGRAIDIPDLNALTTGTGLNIVSNSSDTSERFLVNIHQDHADASGAVGLRVQQDSIADIMKLYQGATSVFSIASQGDITISAPSVFGTTALCWDNSGDSIITDCNGSATDLAELFGTSDATLSAGEIVAADTSRETEKFYKPDDFGNQILTSKAWVVKASATSESSIIGVVSTEPNQVFGNDGVFADIENPRPISLVGRVPVKVNLAGGPIQVGDRIGISTEPGVGMKAASSHNTRTVGIALQSYNGTGDNHIIVFIDLAGSGQGSVAGATDDSSLQSQVLSLVDLIGTDPTALTVVEGQDTAAAPSTNVIQRTLFSRLLALEEQSTQFAQQLAVLSPPAAVTDAAVTDAAADESAVSSAGAGEVAGDSVTADVPSGAAEVPYLTDAIFSEALTFTGALTAQNNLSVLGQLEVHSDVTLFASLIVDTIHVANALNVHGDTTLFGNLTVEGDIEAKGELRLGLGQAGVATLPEGEDHVTVEFADPYSVLPVVTAAITNDFSLYQIKDVTTDGFTIAIPAAATHDLTFSWTAVPVVGLEELLEEQERERSGRPSSSPNTNNAEENSSTPTEENTSSEVTNSEGNVAGEATVSEPAVSPTPSVTPELTPSPSPALEPPNTAGDSVTVEDLVNSSVLPLNNNSGQ